MATCLSFLRVPDIATTVQWYEHLGFKCLGTHQEPGCELDWAILEFDDAAFMLYPDERQEVPKAKDAGLYFKMPSIDELIVKLKSVNAHIIEVNEETEYGRREVVFKDLNGFQVTFSCEPGKQ
jgi:catechol 2,3-dioxygenase-like lactoylglutathione lyase family enzyme